MDSEKLAKKSADHYKGLSEKLQSRLIEAEVDIADLQEEIAGLQKEIDNLHLENESIKQLNVERQDVSKSTDESSDDLKQFSNLKAEIAKMSPEQLINAEIDRLIKLIDGASSSIYNLKNSCQSLIAQGNMQQYDGLQPLPEIAENLLRGKL